MFSGDMWGRLAEAEALYGKEPTNPAIPALKEMLYAQLRGNVLSAPNKNVVVASDPGEDVDDILMLRYCLLEANANVTVVISGGKLAPEQRLDVLRQLPEFRLAEFYKQTGSILFVPDGHVFTEAQDLFVSCGPLHEATLTSLQQNLGVNACMVAVGCNDDFTGAGVNQANLDENGKGKFGVWNEFVAGLKCRRQGLPVDVSRYVLLPNPNSMSGTPFFDIDPTCYEMMVDTTAMFMASRPPPKYAKRVNEGNSIVDYQIAKDCVSLAKNPELLAAGFDTMEAYAKLAEEQGVSEEVVVAAAIPISRTCALGGKYKAGVFGFDPWDQVARKTVACLEPESVPAFKRNLRDLPFFSPAYDPLAVLIGFAAL